MKVSVKSDYAARAVSGLARHYHTGQALKVDDLAARFGIPPNYLVQILLELKAHQIVKSIRGKEGGYMLARQPADISLGDILRAIHGTVYDTPALGDPECPPELRRAWIRLQQTLDQTANSMNFQQLMEEAEGKEKMYYI